MARRRIGAAEQKLKRSAALMAAQCQPKKKPTKARAATLAHLEQLVEEVASCVESDEWGDERPALLVGLFCWFHEHIYEVSVAAELRRYYVTAVQGARKLQEQEFGDDFEVTRDFIRWVWARESDREEWRRKNTKYGKRLTWRQVFVDRALVTEMRLDEARKGGVQ